MPRNPPWSRDELILALDLYFRCDPVHITEAHPEVVALSKFLNGLAIHANRPDRERFRNPNGVYMKLCNFLRLDPSYPGVGLRAGSKLEEEVWREFAGNRERLRHTVEAIRRCAVGHVTEAPGEYDAQGVTGREGSVLFRLHRERERDRSLVRRRKEFARRADGALRCEACGFDFVRQYGPLAGGCIECHHRVPLHRLRPGQVTTLSDLALVCANCHAVLHRSDVEMTVEGLRRRIAQRVAEEGAGQ